MINHIFSLPSTTHWWEVDVTPGEGTHHLEVTKFEGEPTGETGLVAVVYYRPISGTYDNVVPIHRFACCEHPIAGMFISHNFSQIENYVKLVLEALEAESIKYLDENFGHCSQGWEEHFEDSWLVTGTAARIPGTPEGA